MFKCYNYTYFIFESQEGRYMHILIQMIGILGILASVISFQCNKHNKILFFRTMNEFIFAVQYFLLSAYTGMAMNLVGCVRNIIFSKRIEKDKGTKGTIVLFSVLFFIFGIVSWQGVKSVLIIIAKLLSTLAYGNKNTTFVRGTILITSLSWLVYNALVFSIAGVLCETFTLVSIIIGIIRLDIVPKSSPKS